MPLYQISREKRRGRGRPTILAYAQTLPYGVYVTTKVNRQGIKSGIKAECTGSGTNTKI